MTLHVHGQREQCYAHSMVTDDTLIEFATIDIGYGEQWGMANEKGNATFCKPL